MDEGLCEFDALAHAGRVAGHLTVAGLEEANMAEDFGRALAGGVAGEAAHLGHVTDELGGGHIKSEAVMFGHIADVLAEVGTASIDVEAHHFGGAGGGFDDAEEDLDEGALAGTVGTDKADDARLDGEVEVVESFDRAVVFCET